MMTEQQSALTTVWRGDVVIDDRDILFAAGARFLLIDIKPGDEVAVSRETEVTQSEVLRVLDEERLLLRDDCGVGPGAATIDRAIEMPCTICQERTGAVRETDHLHCLRCNMVIRIPSDVTNCQECLDYAREKLSKGGLFVEKVHLYGGQRVARVHARTVAESESLLEWQERLVRTGEPTKAYMSEMSNRGALALTLEDDGNGRSPGDLLGKEEVTGWQGIDIRTKFFRGMSDGHYRALMWGVCLVDTLLEEACREQDKTVEGKDMALAERLATAAFSGEDVTEPMTILGGRRTLIWSNPSREDVEEALEVAEKIVQAGKEEDISEGRARFIFGLFRLATYFRGDGSASFTRDTPLLERVSYLQTLPIPLYDRYMIAVSSWQRRVNKAGNATLLGNC